MKWHLLASPYVFHLPICFFHSFSPSLSILTSLRLAHFLCIPSLDFLFIFPSLSLSLKLWPCSLIHSQPLSLLFFHFLSSTESFYTHEAALLSTRPWLSNTSYWRHTLNAGVRGQKRIRSQITSQFFLIDSSEIAWRSKSNGDFCLETSENQKIPLSSHMRPLFKGSRKYVKLFSEVQSKGISVDFSSKSSIYTSTLPLCCQHLSHLCIF